MKPDPNEMFWDMCCGSGSMSIGAVIRGHHPTKITMVDAGPWGEVWQDMGRGCFPILTLKKLLSDLPKKDQVPNHLIWLSKQPVSREERPAIFLLLQTGSWGGRAIGWDGGWVHQGFRNQCGCKPSCPHPPLRPFPDPFYDRIARLSEKMVGVTGVCADVRDIHPSSGVVYIDPPYEEKKGYPVSGMDVLTYGKSLNVPCWVSESKPLSNHSFQLRSISGRIRGNHSREREEWLSRIDRSDRVDEVYSDDSTT